MNIDYYWLFRYSGRGYQHASNQSHMSSYAFLLNVNLPIYEINSIIYHNWRSANLGHHAYVNYDIRIKDSERQGYNLTVNTKSYCHSRSVIRFNEFLLWRHFAACQGTTFCFTTRLFHGPFWTRFFVAQILSAWSERNNISTCDSRYKCRDAQEKNSFLNWFFEKFMRRDSQNPGLEATWV